MKLSKTQIAVLAGIFLLSIVLYFLPKKVLINTKEGANRDKAQTESSSQPEAANTENLKPVDVILAESITPLSDNEKKDLTLDENSNQTEIMKAMEAFKKLDNKLGVAVCMEKLKDKFGDRDLGMAYYYAFQQSQIDDNKKSIAAKVISILKAYSEKTPDDIMAKCALADCYVNTSSNPMSGIMLLREVIAKDSTNEIALLLLGQFAVKSGQIDKAIGRFQSLIRLYPSNIKYSLYLAQLFADQGAPDKAIETLTSAKKKANRKSAIDSLDNSINHLK